MIPMGTDSHICAYTHALHSHMLYKVLDTISINNKLSQNHLHLQFVSEKRSKADKSLETVEHPRMPKVLG